MTMSAHQPATAPHHQTSCCCIPTSHKVSPTDPCSPGYEMVQITPERVLRVRHVNPLSRNPEFESRMQEFIAKEYSMNGIGSRANSAKVDNDFESSHSPSMRSKRTKSAGPTRTRSSVRDSQLYESPANSAISPSKTAKNTTVPPRENVRTATGVLVDMDGRQSRESDLILDDDIEEIPFDVKQKETAASSGVREAGSQEVTVFMIHGVAGSSDIWKAQVDYFGEKGYEIIVPDLLGHGFSSSSADPSAYEFKNIALDMRFIFDKYCKEKNVIIGHSYGASFASYLAKERSSWVSHLILISGGSPTPLAPQPGIFTWSVCCLACCKPMLQKTFNRNAFHTGTKTSREKAFDVPPYVLKYTMNGQDWEEGSYEYHSKIQARTLLIHGNDDGLISVYEEEEMKSAIQGSVLVVVDKASHMVMMEQPLEVNILIEDFILLDTVET